MKFKPLYNPTKLSCQLTIGNWAPVKGIQKLIGFGRGLSFHRVPYFPYWHHSNSIRLGYNRASMQHPVKLWMYAYVDGKHIQKEMGLHEVGAVIRPSLYWFSNEMVIHISDAKCNLIEYSREVVDTNALSDCIGFMLYPYAEIDGKENKRTPFEVDIKDLKVNGKMIKSDNAFEQLIKLLEKLKDVDESELS